MNAAQGSGLVQRRAGDHCDTGGASSRLTGTSIHEEGARILGASAGACAEQGGAPALGLRDHFRRPDVKDEAAPSSGSGGALPTSSMGGGRVGGRPGRGTRFLAISFPDCGHTHSENHPFTAAFHVHANVLPVGGVAPVSARGPPA